MRPDSVFYNQHRTLTRLARHISEEGFPSAQITVSAQLQNSQEPGQEQGGTHAGATSSGVAGTPGTNTDEELSRVAAEVAGLLELKAQVLSDPHNVTGTWQAGGNPCKFTRVTCDTDGRVTKVKLTSPEDIATMYPNSVNKRGTSIAGELPWPKGTYQLQQMALASLPCSPAFLAFASRLTTLRIANAKLQDPSLPACWGVLKNVTELTLGGCGLTGTLPASWGSLKALKHLDLSDNPNLSGSLPPAWAGMRNLTVLDLSVDTFDGVKSGLAGPLPNAWHTLRNLTVLDLWRTQVTGTLPASWGAMAGLQVLYLSNTSISGTLPPEWSRMTNLTAVHLTGTAISGVLPASWGSLPNLTYVDLLDTGISQPLPSSWRTLCWRDNLYIDLPWHRPNGDRVMLNSVHLNATNNLCQGIHGRHKIVMFVTFALFTVLTIGTCVILRRRVGRWIGSLRSSNVATYDPVYPTLPWEDERLRRRKFSFQPDQPADRDR
ncbi:hypothetical protein WJX72_009009 [[Myrmecia] bisecta]|uniref:Leucine-rich repeat-containing N-terminal plant-type domain-containing protein n=1 Tax=[Myrmecia] bisecta TaxID=41462 RepID=A0AAW1R7M3_9CHLO